MQFEFLLLAVIRYSARWTSTPSWGFTAAGKRLLFPGKTELYSPSVYSLWLL